MAIKDAISDARGMQAKVYKQRVRHGVAVLILIAVIAAGTTGSAGTGWASVVFAAALLAYGFQRLAGDQSATNRVPE